MSFPIMFHVEHIKTLLILSFLAVFIQSCSKPDPNPELKDPIYIDMKNQLSLVEKSLADAKAKVKEGKADLEAAQPQTGKIKLAQQKIFRFEKLQDIYQQQVKYWIIRIEDRLKQDRIDYTRSLKSGSTWPNPKEYESYLSEKRLRLEKIEWDAKKRLEDYKNELNPKKSAGHGESGGADGGSGGGGGGH